MNADKKYLSLFVTPNQAETLFAALEALEAEHIKKRTPAARKVAKDISALRRTLYLTLERAGIY